MRNFLAIALLSLAASSTTLFAATWNLNANGNWNVNANWTAPAIFPNSTDAVAIFGNVITANRNVTLGQDITVGTINFDDNNRYTITAAAGDMLSFMASSGNATINITDINGDGAHRILNDMVFNSSVAINHNSTSIFTLSGAISGSGGLTKNGTGTTDLDNALNNYTGTTTVNAGVLDYITAGSIVGGNTAIINGGSLAIDASMSVADALNFTINSPGTLNQGTSNTITAVTLQGDGNVVLTTTTTAASLFELEGTGASTTFSGTISGGATSGSTNPTAANRMRKLGSSTLTLTGSNTYVSRTFINAGVINVQNSNALGAAGATSGVFVEGTGAALEVQNNVSLNKAINLNGSGIGGNGAIRNVSGNNSLIGTVQIGWSGGPVAAAPATIAVDSGTLTLSGTLQGAQNFTKVGGGTLLITGTGNLTAGTAVSAGTLTVNGTHTSTGGLSIASGATLAGTGTVTSNSSISGTLAPGNSIGTITLVGTQTLLPGSALQIEVSPAVADLVDVTGTFTIQSGSNLQVIPEPANYPAQATYLIVDTSAGVTGTFSNVSVSLPTFLATVLYTTDDIFLTLSGAPFSNLVKGNAKKVAQCLDEENPPLGSDLSLIISQLRFLSTPELQDALDQMQPSELTDLALSQENATLYSNTAIFNRLDQLNRPCTHLNNTPERLTSLWFTPLGAYSNQQGKSQKPGYRAWTGGLTAGLDYAWDTGIVAGAGLGYSYIDLSWKEQRGHSWMQNLYGSLYGSFKNDFAYIFTSVMVGYNHYRTSRHIIFPEDTIIYINRRAGSNHHGIQGSGHLKTGLLFKYGSLTFSPFASADYIYLHEQSFKEHGAESLNLHLKKKNSNFLDLEAGAQLTGCSTYTHFKISPTAKISLIREERVQGKHYRANLEDTSCVFTVNGLNPNRTLFGAAAGITVFLPNENCSLSLDYQGKIGSSFLDNLIEARFFYRF